MLECDLQLALLLSLVQGHSSRLGNPLRQRNPDRRGWFPAGENQPDREIGQPLRLAL